MPSSKRTTRNQPTNPQSEPQTVEDEAASFLNGAPDARQFSGRAFPNAAAAIRPRARLPQDLGAIPTAAAAQGDRNNTKALAAMGELVFLQARPKQLNGYNGAYKAYDVVCIRTDTRQEVRGQITGTALVNRLDQLELPFRDSLVRVDYDGTLMWMFRSEAEAQELDIEE